MESLVSAQNLIAHWWEKRSELNPTTAPSELKSALNWVIEKLGSGSLRIASPHATQAQEWETAQWLKQAVLLSFRVNENQIIPGQFTQFYDKVPLKYTDYTQTDFQEAGIRVVPPATIRQGAYIGKNVVLMPCYVNIGAYIDEGTMVDTWATVGSCAQIGKNVHLSGGVGIGGVLEPLQANPTIIGDNCFIGARSEIVEGVIVEDNCVISMGVYIGQSTKIYNRITGEIHYGRVPAGSVVVPGSLPGQNNLYHLYCAVIIKQVDAKTRAKTSLNQLLRAD